MMSFEGLYQELYFLRLLLYDLKEYNHHGERIVWQCAKLYKPGHTSLRGFTQKIEGILWRIVMTLNKMDAWSQN